MSLEYAAYIIPWVVGGTVATSCIAATATVCTFRYACKGENDSSKDTAEYFKEETTKQHVKGGVVLTDTKQITKIRAAANDSQTILSTTLAHQDNKAAEIIAGKEVGGMTVATLVNTIGSGLSSVSNFFSGNKDVNINGGQNVLISGDNIVNAGDPTLLDGGYEVELAEVDGQIEYPELDENNQIYNPNIVEVVEVDDMLNPQQGQDNNLNKLAEQLIDDQGANNQFIAPELSGEENF